MDGGDEMWRKAEPLEDKENEFKVNFTVFQN